MASNGALGRLNIALGLDSTEFTRGLTKAEHTSKQKMDRIAANAKKVGVAFAAIGAAAVAATAVLVKHSIDNMDAMSKLAQSTGIAIESLTALGYAGDLSGVSVETLGANMVKLTKNMSDAAKGTGDAKDAFLAMGLSVKDSEGNLKSADAMLGDLADKFAGYKDGAEKTALAVAIFGRAGAQMVPMLNGGREGLKQATDEAKKFGLVIEQDAAKAAEQFNDNLSRLQKIQEGWVNQITTAVIPKLTTFTDLLIKGWEETDTLKGSIDTLTTSKGFPDWLNTVGLGLARVVDVVVALGKMVGAITSSFKVVFADVDVLVKGMRALNPANALNPWYDGAADNAAYAKSVKERNQILESANKQWYDLWNEPANKFEQAWMKADELEKFKKSFVGPQAPGVAQLAPAVIKPEKDPKEKVSKSKSSKAERNYLADNLDEMLIRMGEANEWLPAYEIKADKTFDKVGEFALQAARNIQDSLGDGLYNILTGNFKDIGSSFGDMIVKMAADAAAANLAGALFGQYDKDGKVGGILGNVIGKLFGGPSSGITAGPQFSMSAPSFFDSGGYTGPGGKYEPAGIVHKGEYVLNQDATKRMGVGMLNRINKGYANGGLVGGGAASTAGGVSVNITNQGQPVSASQPRVSMDSMGRMIIDIMIGDAQKNGPYIRQLKGVM